jgi:sugar lactone lactonase YvrE
MNVLDRFEEFADDLNHPEGVAWSPFDGCVYAGGEGGELYRITLDRDVETVGSSGGSMLGLAVDGRGHVYACDAGRGEIARFDPATGEIATYARGADGEVLDTPNVAAFDPSGNLYVTCSGESGRPEIVRISPGGRTERWTVAVPGYPNGCVVTPDGSALLVVEAKAERVARVPILATARPASKRTPSCPTRTRTGLPDAEGDLWATLTGRTGSRIAPPARSFSRSTTTWRPLDAPTRHRVDRRATGPRGGRQRRRTVPLGREPRRDQPPHYRRC